MAEGKAGAPLGNTNAFKGLRWRDAVERAVDAWPEPAMGEHNNETMKGINLAAHKFVDKMMEEGDLGFFKEFGDRIDGKPKQTQDLNLNGELQVTEIERKIVDPRDEGTD